MPRLFAIKFWKNKIVLGFSPNFFPLSFFIPTVTPMNNVRTNSVKVFSEDGQGGPPTVERGVSFDQDGKSNVWAIEPKMEVSSKSSEEKTQSAVFAAGGIGAFVALAGVVLSNLPDPNQF